ncbi:MAG: KEOPS complex subunit Pcc1 [Candidatus Diapherotrites archaeon]|nr:KEOPS complex subunit Pcc1 [Candidatus Diapherotrites archaeon]
MFDLSIEIEMRPKEAEIALQAITPELGARQSARSSTAVNIKKGSLLVGISAGDKTALRAAANAALNSIILSKAILEV